MTNDPGGNEQSIDPTQKCVSLVFSFASICRKSFKKKPPAKFGVIDLVYYLQNHFLLIIPYLFVYLISFVLLFFSAHHTAHLGDRVKRTQLGSIVAYFSPPRHICILYF